MKAYRGRRSIAPLILDPGPRCSEWSTSSPGHVNPGKTPGIQWVGGWGGPQSRSGRFWKRKNAGTRTPDHPADSRLYPICFGGRCCLHLWGKKMEEGRIFQALVNLSQTAQSWQPYSPRKISAFEVKRASKYLWSHSPWWAVGTNRVAAAGTSSCWTANSRCSRVWADVEGTPVGWGKGKWGRSDAHWLFGVRNDEPIETWLYRRCSHVFLFEWGQSEDLLVLNTGMYCRFAQGILST